MQGSVPNKFSVDKVNLTCKPQTESLKILSKLNRLWARHHSVDVTICVLKTLLMKTSVAETNADNELKMAH